MTKSTKERRQGASRHRQARNADRGVGEDESVLTTESINLSAGGLQFQSKVALAPLTRVALTLLPAAVRPEGSGAAGWSSVWAWSCAPRRSSTAEQAPVRARVLLHGHVPGGSRAGRAVRGLALHEARGRVPGGRGRSPQEALRVPVTAAGGGTPRSETGYYPSFSPIGPRVPRRRRLMQKLIPRPKLRLYVTLRSRAWPPCPAPRGARATRGSSCASGSGPCPGNGQRLRGPRR